MSDIEHRTEVIRAEINRLLNVAGIKDANDFVIALHRVETYVADTIDIELIDNKIIEIE